MNPEMRTKSGRTLTDEDIEKLAEEAEKGYDISKLTKIECTCHQGRECAPCMRRKGLI